MKTYQVEMRRISAQFTLVTVEAENEDAAEEMAYQHVMNGNAEWQDDETISIDCHATDEVTACMNT